MNGKGMTPDDSLQYPWTEALAAWAILGAPYGADRIVLHVAVDNEVEHGPDHQAAWMILLGIRCGRLTPSVVLYRNTEGADPARTLPPASRNELTGRIEATITAWNGLSPEARVALVEGTDVRARAVELLAWAGPAVRGAERLDAATAKRQLKGARRAAQAQRSGVLLPFKLPEA